MGYPGWHIECSTMSREYLGDCFDIHTGGVDHIPIHHENEIAQSEALTGKKSVDYWMHSEFLLVDNGKMSKSLGNTYTVSDLIEKGYSPLAYRYFCLNGNYRNKLNFTWDALDAAQVSLNRLYAAVAKHKAAAAGNIPSETIEEWKKEFIEAVSDDLNVPLGLGILWKVLKNSEKSHDVYEFALFADQVLGLSIEANSDIKAEEEQAATPEVSQEILDLVEKRTEAKKAKDFKTADAIRDQLKEMGITLIDTKEGVKIVKE
jgi:cysteinyl-tRNA synthetase